MQLRTPLLAAVGAAVVSVGAILAVSTPAQAANLVTNPDFETGNLSGWSCSNGSVVSSPVHGGSKALQGGASASDIGKCTQTVNVAPNTAYTLSAWVRGSYVYLGVTGGASTWTPSATSYSKLTIAFTTTASQSSVQIYLHGWYAQGAYNADDIALDGPGTPPTTAPPTTPNTSPKPTTPPPTTAPPTTRPPTTAPPTTTPPGNWHEAAPYLYFGWGEPPAPSTVMTATGIKHFTLAFMLSGGGCVPKWDSQRPLTGGVDQQNINAIRAAGGDIEISFGGWSGNKLGPNCSSAAALADAYQQVINAYSLKVIDIDIENTDEFENYTVQDRILGALKIIKANNPGIKTVVTFGTATSGPTEHGVRLINQAKALNANIDVYTIMPFDFGNASTNMYTATVSASEGLKNQLKSTFGWSDAVAYSKMGISGMNGLSDTNETTSVAQWTQIRDWANSKHLARLAFWSVNRDRPCPGGGLQETCSGIAQQNWEFTKISAGFTG
ncbi:carbohydrate binding domain-containing protein [Longispora urticae]